MKHWQYLLTSAALLTVVACGPAEVSNTANTAIAAAETALPTAAAALNDPTAQALLNDPTAQALLNDPTAQALLNDPTTQAIIGDPTAQALANDTVANLAGLVPSDLRLQRDQPLVLDTTKELAGVTNYKWTIGVVPPGAESVQGKVINENSNGKLTIEPADYAQYFPVAGSYALILELTFTDGSKQSLPVPLIVP